MSAITIFLLPARVLLAVLFAVAAVSKVRNRAARASFSGSLRSFGVVPAPAAPAAAVVVVLAEAAVPALLVWPERTVTTVGFALATILLAILTAMVARAVARGLATPCRCFGASARPVGVPHVVRNAVATAIAASGTTLSWLAPPPPPGGASMLTVVTAAAAGIAGALVLMRFDDIAELLGPSRAVSPSRRQM